MTNSYLIDRYILAELVDSHNNIHWEDIADMPKVDAIPISVIDDIKAEIQDIYVGYRHGYEIMADVLEILNKHITR